MAENSDKPWAARELAASVASLSKIARELARADPEAYLADVIDRMAKGHSINRIDELLSLELAAKPGQIGGMTASSCDAIAVLRIEIEYIEPLIWRRVAARRLPTRRAISCF
jgi:hypothetical protein